MPMKLALSTGVLFLLLGTIDPAYAQREEQEKEQGKPQQGEQHQQEKAAPQQRQQEKPAPQQAQHQQAANKPAPRPTSLRRRLSCRRQAHGTYLWRRPP